MHKMFLLIAVIFLLSPRSYAQYPPEDKWYSNPLGFKPVQLHTAMGFLLPAAAVGAGLLLTKKDPNLQQRLSIYNESGVSWGYKYPYTLLTQNNTGFNFQLRRWMSAGIEFSAYFPRDSVNTSVGLAIRPFARFYPVNRERWNLYFESGGGFIYFFDAFPQPTDRDPRRGTNFNGVTKYGIGSEIRFNHSTALLLGVRHVHVSNGDSKGAARNPSHDSNGFYVGFSFRP
jgi:hypothetical protein